MFDVVRRKSMTPGIKTLPGGSLISLGVSIFRCASVRAFNRRFVAGFEKLGGIRPNFVGVGGYDGMALIYKALEKTRGETDSAALLEARKGLAWESPRGPISIDPHTREIVQNVYMRKVEKVDDGHLRNIEFETFPDVKDPSK